MPLRSILPHVNFKDVQGRMLKSIENRSCQCVPMENITSAVVMHESSSRPVILKRESKHMYSLHQNKLYNKFHLEVSIIMIRES